MIQRPKPSEPAAEPNSGPPAVENGLKVAAAEGSRPVAAAAAPHAAAAAPRAAAAPGTAEEELARLTVQHSHITVQYSQTLTQLDQLRAECEQTNARIATLKGSNDDLHRELEELKAELRHVTEVDAAKEETLTKLNMSRLRAEKKVEKLLAEAGPLQSENRKLKAAAKALTDENAELSIKLQKGQSNRDERVVELQAALDKATIESRVMKEKFDQFVNEKVALTATVKELEQQHAGAAGEQGRLKEQLAAKEKEAEQRQASLDDAQRQLKEQLAAKDGEANEFKEKAKKNIVQLTVQNKQLAAQQEAMKEKLVALAKEREILTRKSETVEAAVKALKEKAQAVQEDRDKLSSQCTEANANLKDLTEKLKARTAELERATGEATAAAQKLETIEAKLAEVEKRAASGGDFKDKYEAAVCENQVLNEKLEELFAEADARNKAHGEELDALRRSVAAADEKVAGLAKQVSELTAAGQKLRDQLAAAGKNNAADEELERARVENEVLTDELAANAAKLKELEAAVSSAAEMRERAARLQAENKHFRKTFAQQKARLDELEAAAGKAGAGPQLSEELERLRVENEILNEKLEELLSAS